MAKKSSKAANKSSEYDSNGRWVQEKTRIKGAIRRTFRLFPQLKEALNNARVELPPALKKDGTPGKKNQVRFKCALCGGLFSRKAVQVDHISPVVPLNKSESNMSYDELVFNICCSIDNLQVICSTPMKMNGGLPSCHKKKTDKENWIRNNRDVLGPDSDFDELYNTYLKEKEEKKNNKKKRSKKK